MLTDKYPLINGCELFRGADFSFIDRIFSDGEIEIRAYKRGETVISPELGENFAGIVLSGRACVYSSDGERNVLIKTLEPKDPFGLANILSTDELFPSRIIAKTSAEILIITPSAMRKIIESDKAVMYNFISAVTSRIRFLNNRITSFTGGSAERRLALYLLSLSDGEEIVLTVPVSSLATSLDIGRASLYRAADRLESDGYIVRTGTKNIKITDRSKLADAYK